MEKTRTGILVALACVCLGCAGGSTDDSVTVRIGYFPNITHSQALVGMAAERQDFRKAFGNEVGVDVKIFNAGPSAIEALFAGELDLAYIGPNPAINGYVKSKGSALRIIAGATSGGAVLVVRPGSAIQKASDLAGRKIASPQLGNTQDVALRYYLLENKLRLTEYGGNVAVIPAQNPDILTLFLKEEIDAAWVPEPWGARLVREGGGVVFVDERDLWPERKFVTANVIVSAAFLQAHPDLVKRFLRAHVDVTEWIVSHPEEAKDIANTEIARLTGKAIPLNVLHDAWSRIDVTYDPIAPSLYTSAQRAFSLGYLGKDEPDLDEIYDLSLLNEVLREKGLPPMQTLSVHVASGER